jgi:hypothetical protein
LFDFKIKILCYQGQTLLKNPIKRVSNCLKTYRSPIYGSEKPCLKTISYHCPNSAILSYSWRIPLSKDSFHENLWTFRNLITTDFNTSTIMEVSTPILITLSTIHVWWNFYNHTETKISWFLWRITNIPEKKLNKPQPIWYLHHIPKCLCSKKCLTRLIRLNRKSGNLQVSDLLGSSRSPFNWLWSNASTILMIGHGLMLRMKF